MDSHQYDTIGTTYNAVKLIPGSLLERHTVRQAVQPYIENARVLDLACGTGYYSRLLLKWGARSVLGVDISEVMIEGAKKGSIGVGAATNGEKDWMNQGRLKFRVGDCLEPTRFYDETQPSNKEDNNNGENDKFDLVVGVWLLNYASSSSELTQFLTTIALNLRPGGPFFGIVPNILATGLEFEKFYAVLSGNVKDEDETTIHRKYGPTITMKKELDNGEGYFVHVNMHTIPTRVRFDTYILKQSVYEKCFGQVDLEGPRWIRPRGPKTGDDILSWEDGLIRDEFKRIQMQEGDDYWDDLNEVPLFVGLILRKP